MGKAKYQKRFQSATGSKTERNPASLPKKIFKNASCSKEKEEVRAFRHFQRRLAITPNDLNDEERLGKVVQEISFGKDQDRVFSLTKINKRAKKRALAKMKLAGAFGNMDSLIDALPVLNENSKISSRSDKEKPRLSRRFKMQELEMANDIKWYRGAVQDPYFLADPFSAAMANIRQRLMNEQKK